MEYIEKHWKTLLALLVTTILIIAGAAWFFHWQQAQQDALHKAQQLTQQQTESIKSLQENLSISNDNAAAVAKHIEDIQARAYRPSVTFQVASSTPAAAAADVERRIDAGDMTLPATAIEKTDRTIVTPITKDVAGNDIPAADQRVDVYKINLRKDHRIKAGITAAGGRAYTTIGYEQGKIEGLIHFDGAKPDGGSVMYNIAEW